LLSALSDASMSFLTRDASCITAFSALAVVGPSCGLGFPALTDVCRALSSELVILAVHGAAQAKKAAEVHAVNFHARQIAALGSTTQIVGRENRGFLDERYPEPRQVQP
jgi:hypothetical protein